MVLFDNQGLFWLVDADTGSNIPLISWAVILEDS